MRYFLPIVIGFTILVLTVGNVMLELANEKLSRELRQVTAERQIELNNCGSARP